MDSTPNLIPSPTPSPTPSSPKSSRSRRLSSPYATTLAPLPPHVLAQHPKCDEGFPQNVPTLGSLKVHDGKTGIYCWQLVWTNSDGTEVIVFNYVGSAINLANRAGDYWSEHILTAAIQSSKGSNQNKPGSLISKALLQLGHQNFNLRILEYCELINLTEREQYWMDTLKTTLNVNNANSATAKSRRTKAQALVTFRAIDEVSLNAYQHGLVIVPPVVKSGMDTVAAQINRRKATQSLLTASAGGTKPVYSVTVIDLYTGLTTNYPSKRAACRVCDVESSHSHLTSMAGYVWADQYVPTLYEVSKPLQPRLIKPALNMTEVHLHRVVSKDQPYVLDSTVDVNKLRFSSQMACTNFVGYNVSKYDGQVIYIKHHQSRLTGYYLVLYNQNNIGNHS